MVKLLNLIGTGIGALVVVGQPLSAQMSKPISETPPPEHAEIGKLEWYNPEDQFIGIRLPLHDMSMASPECQGLPVSRNYRIDGGTHVIGEVPMAGGTTRGLIGEEGSLVLLKYAYDGERLYTPWVMYVGGGEVREADGMVESIDVTKKEIVVRNDSDALETIELRQHSLIDTPGGLATLADLHIGESIRGYYIRRAGKNIGYLVRAMMTSSTMSPTPNPTRTKRVGLVHSSFLLGT